MATKLSGLLWQHAWAPKKHPYFRVRTIRIYYA
jgi:hypothetical protein